MEDSYKFQIMSHSIENLIEELCKKLVFTTSRTIKQIVVFHPARAARGFSGDLPE